MDLDALLDTVRRSAFRLERVERGEDQADEPTLAWHQPWLEAIQRAVAAGRVVRRVRVVDEPPTPFQSLELSLDRYRVAAGEEVRVLPLALARSLEIPPIDFWLLDDERAVSMTFDKAGILVGSEWLTGPAEVRRLRTLRDLAWTHAHPHTP
jgi:hypothetical protein